MIFLTISLAFIISLALFPVARWLSFSTGKVAYPRQDRWHREPTPKMGGVGIFAATVLTIVVVDIANSSLTLHWSLVAASFLMFMLGFADDILDLSPTFKLVFQIAASILVVFWGNYQIEFFPWPVANIVLTMVWLVGITNAINLLDNMDGLAGGITLIAAGFLGFFFWMVEDQSMLVVTLVLAGSIAGFLWFNFPPAKIFMGDSGSLFIGFTLAELAVTRRTQASNVLAVLFVPIMIFLLPILDTSLVTVTRLLRGQSPAQGGTDHTSHRLVMFGLSERNSVLTLYLVGVISGMAGVALETLDYDLSLALVPIILVVFLMLTAFLGRVKVANQSEYPKPTGMAEIVINNLIRRRALDLLLDLILFSVVYYLAYWIHYGLDMTGVSMDYFLRTWPVAVISSYIMSFVFGIYRTLWSSISIHSLTRYLLASILTGVLTFVLISILDSTIEVPIGVIIIFSLFTFFSLTGSRSFFILLEKFIIPRPTSVAAQSVLVYDSSQKSDLVVRWLQENPESEFHVVGILDASPQKWGRDLRNIPILGRSKEIGDVIEKYRVVGVMFPDRHSLEEYKMTNLAEMCKEMGLWLRVVKLDFEQIDE